MHAFLYPTESFQHLTLPSLNHIISISKPFSKPSKTHRTPTRQLTCSPERAASTRGYPRAPAARKCRVMWWVAGESDSALITPLLRVRGQRKLCSPSHSFGHFLSFLLLLPSSLFFFSLWICLSFFRLLTASLIFDLFTFPLSTCPFPRLSLNQFIFSLPTCLLPPLPQPFPLSLTAFPFLPSRQANKIT